eukprot:4565270-Pyramimonas_sp.AAC.1
MQTAQGCAATRMASSSASIPARPSPPSLCLVTFASVTVHGCASSSDGGSQLFMLEAYPLAAAAAAL